MIKYLYLIMTTIILITVVEGVPVIDIFSTSWHVLATWSLAMIAFLSLFGSIVILVGYAEEHEDTQCDLQCSSYVPPLV